MQGYFLHSFNLPKSWDNRPDNEGIELLIEGSQIVHLVSDICMLKRKLVVSESCITLRTLPIGSIFTLYSSFVGLFS